MLSAMRRPPRVGALLVAPVATLAIIGSMTGSASAAGLSLAQGNGAFVLHYQADPGETNHVDIAVFDGKAASDTPAVDGQLVIKDVVPIEIHDGHCFNFTNQGHTQTEDDTLEVHCFYGPADGGPVTGAGGSVEADLGDRDDTIRIAGRVREIGATGDAGNDTLDGTSALAAGFDGGSGNDTLIGTGTRDQLAGGSGNDAILEPAGCRTGHADGGPGRDTLSFARCNTGRGVKFNLAKRQRFKRFETYIGTRFDDRMTGSGRGETLIGDAGNDRLDGKGGRDLISGGEGDDVLYGGAGNDALDGGGGFKDVLHGGPGDDHLGGTGEQSSSTFEGEAGDDDLFIDAGRGSGGSGDDRLTCTKRCSLSGQSGNDRLSCLQACTLDGGTGNDRVTGGSAEEGDTLVGGPGRDVYDGGGGGGTPPGTCTIYSCPPQPDTLTFAKSRTGVRVTVDGRADSGAPGAHARVTRITKVIGGKGDDTLVADSGRASWLIGGGGNDRLVGGGKADVLDAGAGDDRVAGGGGNDSITGGTGADDLRGGDGIDTVDYRDHAAGVTVTLDDRTGDGNASDESVRARAGAVTPLPTTAPRDDVHSDVENLSGTSKADHLTGDRQANRLDGGFGADVLAGGAGDDTLNGGVVQRYPDGSFLRSVDDAGDTVTGGPGNDVVRGGPLADTLDGGAGNDRVTGFGGKDTLSGGAGDDIVSGGGGDDSLAGGPGTDVFQCGIGDDTVTDFANGEHADGCEHGVLQAG